MTTRPGQTFVPPCSSLSVPEPKPTVETFFSLFPENRHHRVDSVIISQITVLQIKGRRWLSYRGNIKPPPLIVKNEKPPSPKLPPARPAPRFHNEAPPKEEDYQPSADLLAAFATLPKDMYNPTTDTVLPAKRPIKRMDPRLLYLYDVLKIPQTRMITSHLKIS